ncbi:MAG: serpin family protein [Lachnospiraceae bacterium]|nr:serpin family protein [Lachnospiraceae bacterium]
MKDKWKKMTALLCGAAISCSSTFGCFAEEAVQTDGETENTAWTADAGVQITDFSVRLLQECAQENENLMISPVSVMAVFAMLGNGAAGETLTQMEAVFGMKMPELNQYLQVYLDALAKSKGCEWNIGNSIWLNGEGGAGAVKESFLEANTGYHGAEVVSLPFDEAALERVNQWVSDKTNGRIDRMLDDISPDSMMYLINAIAFQGEWAKAYEEYQIEDGIFTKEDGTEQETKLMYSEESSYLSDDTASGFLKYYQGSRYAFAALLPEEGVALQDYLSSLTGEKLYGVLQNAREATVYTKLPKFKSEYSVELNTALEQMGITDAFQELADFSGISDIPLRVDRVLHKTFIDVNEHGTEAAAATIVETKAMAAFPGEDDEQQIYQVYLDRPFLYMIVDTDSMNPIFIGTVTQTAE